MAGTFGVALERARTSQGLSVEAAAAKAKLTPEQWRALEAEQSGRFTIAPYGYAAGPGARDEVSAGARLTAPFSLPSSPTADSTDDYSI